MNLMWPMLPQYFDWPTNSRKVGWFKLDWKAIILPTSPTPSTTSSPSPSSLPPSSAPSSPLEVSTPSKPLTRSPSVTTSKSDSSPAKKKYRIGSCANCQPSKSITFNSRTSNQDIAIYVFDHNNEQEAAVELQKNTFKPGCTLTVNLTRSPAAGDGKGGCGSSSARIVSVGIELNLYGGSECDSSNLRRAVGLEFRSKHRGDGTCVAFNKESERDDPIWHCLSDIDTKAYGDDSILESKTTHFTTFAVLFQPTDGCDDWIWISSLVMVGSCLFGSIIIVVVYYQSKRFRAVVGGFKADTVSHVIQKATRIHN
eukprot:TRINITY_DN5650_c0_g2_i1.p1 TRINITY_DN5650_c0_g2~~TRINITY_DN5650_c0_g2_i1.p1  ORF type:complete len:312 (+),score=34.25 TRINITY_DN5650_c0_g2_i1:1-936(+)